MIVLGLDYGDRRIGVAASDPLGLTAGPHVVIDRRSLGEDIARIRELMNRKGAEAIVMGLPLNMDGTPGPMARRVRRFASALRRELNVEVQLWDERLTTREAEQALLASDERRARRRQMRDAISAALILQSYLDSQRGDAQG